MTKITRGTPVHCNRCNKVFEMPIDGERQIFAGQRATRIETFVECPHCGQKDAHWLFAADVMPEFDGNFDARKRAARRWMLEN